jgi:hypothetical protein
MYVAVTSATSLTTLAGVAGSARSFTHIRVRSLACSPAPWPATAMAAASRNGDDSTGRS